MNRLFLALLALACLAVAAAPLPAQTAGGPSIIQQH
jgi:hypothetical protein